MLIIAPRRALATTHRKLLFWTKKLGVSQTVQLISEPCSKSDVTKCYMNFLKTTRWGTWKTKSSAWKTQTKLVRTSLTCKLKRHSPSKKVSSLLPLVGEKTLRTETTHQLTWRTKGIYIYMGETRSTNKPLRCPLSTPDLSQQHPCDRSFLTFSKSIFQI